MQTQLQASQPERPPTTLCGTPGSAFFKAAATACIFTLFFDATTTDSCPAAVMADDTVCMPQRSHWNKSLGANRL
jgi:hypothetical protein